MSGDDLSAWEVILVVGLVLFFWFIGIPFVGELTTTHTETITVRGIAGDTVEDLQGNLWRLQDLDRYTLAEIRPGTSLEVRWTGPQGIRDQTTVSVENITWVREPEPPVP